MPHISNAIPWALARYNDDADFRCTVVEIGNVLFADRVTGALRPGQNEYGETASQVRPYASSLEKLLEHMAGQGDVFLGDYHCHVGSGLEWTDHVPSPEDLSRQSCLADLWRLDPPLDLGGTMVGDLSISPSFQIVQANIFGDLFVIAPTPGRARFLNLEQQDEILSDVARAYGLWHMVSRAKYGALTFPVRHSDFVAQVRAELPAMNATLRDRATMSFVENTAFVSDDEEFLAE